MYWKYTRGHMIQPNLWFVWIDSDTKPVTVTYGDITLTLEFGKSSMTKAVKGGSPQTVKLPTAPSMAEGPCDIP